MRIPAALISSILAMSSGGGDPPRPPSLATTLERSGAQFGDTGDILVEKAMERSASRASRRDSLVRPLTECPMPVDRPDPGLSVPIPTGRDLAPRSSAPLRGQVSEMPVIRSGCWNPLDRRRGDRDSAWIDGGPVQRP